jgi:hypothetical protein
MKFHNALTAASLAVMTLVVPLVAPSPAHAEDWDEWMYTEDIFAGGRVEFRAYGDVVKLCDTDADGHKVWLQVRDDTDGKLQYTYTIGGEDRCQEFRSSLGGKYDLAEGHTFEFKICLMHYDHKEFCDTAYWKNNN